MHIVTIYDTYCCIFVLQYIVARYIVTPLVDTAVYWNHLQAFLPQTDALLGSNLRYYSKMCPFLLQM